MYKLTKLFLTINKWVALGVAVFCAGGFLWDFIWSFVDGYFHGGMIFDILYCGAALFSFFYAGVQASKGFDAAKCPADAKTPGIWAIVSGVLGGIMGIPAGIFMLIMKDAHYAEAGVAGEAKAEDKKAE